MKLNFKKSQRIRIIANDVCIYSTVGRYAFTLGNGWIINGTFCALMDLQTNGGRGIVRSFQDRQIQVDLLEG